MKKQVVALAGLILAVGQIGCSVFGVRTVDEPEYNILESVESAPIEVREYSEIIVARTTVDANYDDASTVAFRRLFRYISGENTVGGKIAMTAPVETSRRSKSGEKIAMTAPVFQDATEERWTMAFVMPAKYTMDDVPRPTNPDVEVALLPPRRVAVLTFNGRYDDETFASQSAKLESWVRDRGLEPTSSPRLAGYDPPYTLPFLRRNEVHIDVRER